MEKKDFLQLSLTKLAVIGLINGALINGGLVAETKTTVTNPATVTEDPNSENLGYHLMSEEELLLELNDEGTKVYKALSPEGKKLARETASQRCQGTNECNGLNACKTDNNDCAGQADCKGKTKCAIADKNLAVRLVAKKMAEKRNASLQKK